ncbi:hypothetical protein Cs7R123_55050 [Catellatospora sp. TT07R-123]|nr:hypothetical protein Cs7R123_55050 [Catellatospora sp. TT07R-123]
MWSLSDTCHSLLESARLKFATTPVVPPVLPPVTQVTPTPPPPPAPPPPEASIMNLWPCSTACRVHNSLIDCG